MKLQKEKKKKRGCSSVNFVEDYAYKWLKRNDAHLPVMAVVVKIP